MGTNAIEVENLAKSYHLGTIGYGSLKADFHSFMAKIKGQADPNRQMDADDRAHREFWAIKQVNFQLAQGDRLGIIGKNGAGKSTLLKILSRITCPTKGEIRVRGRVASLLEVGTGFIGELTGRDNVYLNGAVLGMKRKEIQRKFDEIVAFSEIDDFIDTPVKRYSSGMYVRLAFSVAAHLEADVMVLDEVLAVGDAAFQNKCLEKLKSLNQDTGRTILFVSHRIEQIQQLCNKALYLDGGFGDGTTEDVAGVLEKYMHKDPS